MEFIVVPLDFLASGLPANPAHGGSGDPLQHLSTYSLGELGQAGSCRVSPNPLLAHAVEREGRENPPLVGSSSARGAGEAAEDRPARFPWEGAHQTAQPPTVEYGCDGTIANPMPESVRDRPTRAHSTVYLLTKRADYFYDPDAVREPQSGGAHSRGNLSVQKLAPEDSNIRSKPSFHASMHDLPLGTGRNLRSVWTIPTQAFSESHYATFPTRLPEICISAGTSERGCCPECGAPFERVVGLGEPQRDWQAKSGGNRNGRYDGEATKDYLSAGAEDASEVKRRILDSMRERLTVGWTPTCRCFPDPCDRCGVPWDRRTVVRKVSTFNVRVLDAKTGVLGFKSGLGGATADASADEVGAYEGGSSGSSSPYRYREIEVSWPGCKCRLLVPAVVMDPFAGSGTTLAVARRLYRRSVGVELSAYYTDMARRRVTEVSSKLAPRPVSQARLSEFAEVPA